NVRLIEHNYRSEIKESLDRLVRLPTAGWIVGRGQKYEAGSGCDRSSNSFDVNVPVVGPRRLDALPAAELRREEIHAERGRAVDHFVTRLKVHPAEQVDELVGAIPEYEGIGRDARICGHGCPQRLLIRIGVPMVKGKLSERF